MTRVRTVFVCQSCGLESSKWLGRCPDCGEWNSYIEELREERAAPARAAVPAPMAREEAEPGARVGDGQGACRRAPPRHASRATCR